MIKSKDVDRFIDGTITDYSWAFGVIPCPSCVPASEFSGCKRCAGLRARKVTAYRMEQGVKMSDPMFAAYLTEIARYKIYGGRVKRVGQVAVRQMYAAGESRPSGMYSVIGNNVLILGGISKYLLQ